MPEIAVAASGGRPITLLHLSDPQFGKNHRFAQRDLSGWDAPFETLLSRLAEDLRSLRDQHGLTPDLLVVSGDLAEWGLRSEFEDALKFLRGLCEFLHLPSSRVALIPGNHDINRKLCQSYFDECEGNEISPAPPFWPKWKHYAWLFNELYADTPGVQFTEEIPWSLFVFEDLNVAVAGLNSTMRESHRDEDHYGWVGERQLTWFRDQLEPYRRDGWLRIGAVHHNYRRGPTRDDENLRDADDLKRILGQSLNLLLHGHTHDGKLDWIRPGLPVLSTGSAALKSDQRPSEVPNQYQVLQVWADRFCRWTRGFAPDEKRWIGDNRASESGGRWWDEQRTVFQDVSGTFPKRALPEEPEPGDIKEEELRRFTMVDRSDRDRDDFLSRVQAVCRLREPGADVERIPGTGSAFGDYLRVIRRNGSILETYPVGAVEHGCTQESLKAFLNDVDARYRRADPYLISVLIYGGEPTSEKLLKEAEARRVRLQSFLEYQGLIDFRSYLEQQTARLAANPIYPPRLYVQQRMRTVSLLGREEEETADALAKVREWLASPHGRFLVLLGDFGTGKTFLVHELARCMGEETGDGLVPILLQMRSLEKGRSLDALLAQHFAQEGMEGFSPAKFRYMLEQGRVALLFDGFDELALRVTYSKAADHFDTLLQAATGNAKVVLTSRRQHFLSEDQVKTALTERVESLAGHRLGILQPFTKAQVRSFLVKFFDGEKTKAEARLDLIDRVRDLLGLSANPRLLGFIAELPEEKLVEACAESGEITAAKLYELLLSRWLIFEFDRIHPKGAPPGLSVEVRWQAVTLLAMKLWQKTDRSVSLSELTEEAVRVVQAVGSAALDKEIAAFQVGSGTLLVRDEEGNFSFLHQSILEWLVARRAAEELTKGVASEALAAREISPLMADFFASLAGREKASAWARSVLTGPAGEMAKKNALLILKDLRSIDLSSQDLRGIDLSGQDLSGADLSRADLTSSLLVAAQLAKAKLVKTRLRNADLSDAFLKGADLSGADLTGARLAGADLRETRLTQAIFRRAKLLGAALNARELDKADVFGAAWNGSLDILAQQLLPTRECRALAWSPDGELLASADENVIRLWEVNSGRQIRALTGHRNGIRSIVFSPDGKILASGSKDRTIRLWQVDIGREIRILTGHKDSVRVVVFSPDGTTLASGSADKTIRLWEADRGRKLRALTGHRDWVRSVAFGPDGKTLASGSDDKTVRLWQVDSGSEIRVLTGHQSGLRSVAFSQDGKILATSSADRTVRLWQVDGGREVRILTGHQESVRMVAFSPDGKTLASGSADHTVRLWQADSGRKICALGGHQEAVRTVAFSPDGKTLASGSADQTIRFWQLDDRREVRSLSGEQKGVLSVVFSPDGKTLASGSADQIVRLWHLGSGREIRTLTGHQNVVSSLAFSSDGQILASSSDDQVVRLWSVDSGREIRALAGHQKGGLSVVFSPDGQTLASGSSDQTVRLWQVHNGCEVRILQHQSGVRSVAFRPDGNTLASGCDDKAVRLWQVDDGREIRTLLGHQNAINGLAFSSDGKLLASGSSDRSIRLWQVEDGSDVHVFTGHHDRVWSVAFSPDGRILASGSEDRTVHLWEVASGHEIRSLTGHQSGVWSVAFSPDGTTLASGSYGGTIRLWDVATGRCLAVLVPLPEGWVAFSPDGRYKFGGVPAGGFWHAINLCRFEIGELDEWIPGLRLPSDASFFDLPPWKPEVRSPHRTPTPS